jgi:hypothetical protein
MGEPETPVEAYHRFFEEELLTAQEEHISFLERQQTLSEKTARFTRNLATPLVGATVILGLITEMPAREIAIESTALGLSAAGLYMLSSASSLIFRKLIDQEHQKPWA